MATPDLIMLAVLLGTLLGTLMIYDLTRVARRKRSLTLRVVDGLLDLFSLAD